MTGLPDDPIFDPVGIVVWAIDVGIYDVMYSAWGWPIVEIVHFTGLCLLMGAVGMFDLRMMGLVRGLSLPALHRLVPFGVLGFALSVGERVHVRDLVARPVPLQPGVAGEDGPARARRAQHGAVLPDHLAAAEGARARRRRRRSPRGCSPGVSLTCWLGVIAAGRVITAFRPPSWFWCAWCSLAA